MKEEMDERVKNKIKTNKINKERTMINIEKMRRKRRFSLTFFEVS